MLALALLLVPFSGAAVHARLQQRWAEQARTYFASSSPRPESIAGLLGLADKAESRALAEAVNESAAKVVGDPDALGAEAKMAALLQPAFFSLLTQENKDALMLEARERRESLAAHRERLQSLMEATADRLAWGPIMDERGAVTVHEEGGTQKRIALQHAVPETADRRAARAFEEFFSSDSGDAAKAAGPVRFAMERGLSELNAFQTAAGLAASSTAKLHASGGASRDIIAARLAVLLHPRILRLLNSIQGRRLQQIAAGYVYEHSGQSQRLKAALEEQH